MVTVVYGGNVLMSRGYGFADVAKGIPVNPASTLFRPGSVSKLFTWVALMQQIERGKVNMDSDVNQYLDFVIPPFEGKPVLVSDLFAHTPGMSDSSGISTDNPAKAEPFTKWMKTHIPKRVWAPGTETSYSNYGAALAGYIVERVSGEPFADYTERHIFQPLGMKSTTFREDLPPAMRQRSALGYKFEDGRLIAQPVEYYGVIMPAGSSSATRHRHVALHAGDARRRAARQRAHPGARVGQAVVLGQLRQRARAGGHGARLHGPPHQRATARRARRQHPATSTRTWFSRPTSGSASSSR